MVPGRIGVGAMRRVVPANRNVLVVQDLRPLTQELETLATGWLPQVFEPLGLKPFETGSLGLSLVAYGDGAFYRRHVDTHVGVTGGSRGPRRVTFVCYFLRQPKAFNGGALRLYQPLGTETIDIEPEHRLVTAFPSWIPHEVLPVSCPSGDLADYRFGLNIWVHGPASTGTA